MTRSPQCFFGQATAEGCAGRLNVLANVVRKPMRQIFSEFGGVMPSGADYGTGDVKYHLGTSYDRPTISGKQVHLSLLANPSHLEVSRRTAASSPALAPHCELDFTCPLERATQPSKQCPQ